MTPIQRLTDYREELEETCRKYQIEAADARARAEVIEEIIDELGELIDGMREETP
jgi:hypothetical protein